ncbi:hypothetical protein BO83DRAFT_377317 [Aspergillus eucalypticola CBS 122712]|uniref:Uncharacterized protein n=1 Tax=Aspergillus eucalypticola (strain CBS 122712 / IBT 29274) TaxID=1448314 RepID=A0A317VV48_ASPEC|nr:uncharacterized protein BO83DRAFT_377317 [Aspergillus eucalypticola CBS 122712]PWY76847.1 hypothetical protein BO83DRAFT_377317 [Aspergillus eucalypticola CBS 122712]
MFGLSRGGLPVAWMGMAMIAAGIGISPSFSSIPDEKTGSPPSEQEDEEDDVIDDDDDNNYWISLQEQILHIVNQNDDWSVTERLINCNLRAEYLN